MSPMEEVFLGHLSVRAIVGVTWPRYHQPGPSLGLEEVLPQQANPIRSQRPVVARYSPMYRVALVIISPYSRRVKYI